MPLAELGIHGLNRWAVNCLEMSGKREKRATQFLATSRYRQPSNVAASATRNWVCFA